MAVQFADKALDEWINGSKAHMHKNGIADNYDLGYLRALVDTKKQLYALCGSALKED